jgi:hypothetical protein
MMAYKVKKVLKTMLIVGNVLAIFRVDWVNLMKQNADAPIQNNDNLLPASVP